MRLSQEPSLPSKSFDFWGFAGAAERAERNARERERQELIHAKLKEDRENS